jgi:mono/diheme cytochrome c family protein
MMLMTHAEWNRQMAQENYDQAWTMVQFLAHAENGKYQGAFVKFMRAIATGQKWDAAWLNSFGSAEGFERTWAAYWMKLDDDPTAHLYARAVTETITGTLGRATAQKQKFESFEQLAAAAKANAVRIEKALAPYAARAVTELETDPAALNVGRNLFLNNCATCHGSDGGGAPGFPNLTDRDWLWGGEPDTVVATIANGRAGVMPAWSDARFGFSTTCPLTFFAGASGVSPSCTYHPKRPFMT